MAGYNIPRSFAQGTIFGASVAILATGVAMVTGGAGLFLGAGGIGGIALEFMAGSAAGMMVMGPLFAASDVVVHTIPGLAHLVGADKIKRSELNERGPAMGKALADPDSKNFQRLEHIEQHIFASDHVKTNHAAMIEAEREMAEARAQEAASAQR